MKLIPNTELPTAGVRDQTHGNANSFLPCDAALMSEAVELWGVNAAKEINLAARKQAALQRLPFSDALMDIFQSNRALPHHLGKIASAGCLWTHAITHLGEKMTMIVWRTAWARTGDGGSFSEHLREEIIRATKIAPGPHAVVIDEKRLHPDIVADVQIRTRERPFFYPTPVYPKQSRCRDPQVATQDQWRTLQGIGAAAIVAQAIRDLFAPVAGGSDQPVRRLEDILDTEDSLKRMRGEPGPNDALHGAIANIHQRESAKRPNEL